MNIDDLELSVRTANALRLHGVTEIDSLESLTWSEFKQWTQVGRKSWNEIQEVLRWLSDREKHLQRKQTQSAFLDWCLENREGLELIRAKKACIVVDFKGLEFVPDEFES